MLKRVKVQFLFLLFSSWCFMFSACPAGAGATGPRRRATGLKHRSSYSSKVRRALHPADEMSPGQVLVSGLEVDTSEESSISVVPEMLAFSPDTVSRDAHEKQELKLYSIVMRSINRNGTLSR